MLVVQSKVNKLAKITDLYHVFHFGRNRRIILFFYSKLEKEFGEDDWEHLNQFSSTVFNEG